MSTVATALQLESGTIRRIPFSGGAMLSVPRLAETVEASWFDPARWLGHGRLYDTAGGRGGSLVVKTPIGPVLLRRYLRGGMAARFSRDRYLYRGEEATRSFREFRLLHELSERGLPVPSPLAAAYWRRGLFYRAAIMLHFIPGARPLPLLFEDLAESDFLAIGRAVGRLHAVGVRHADLNAWNVLLDSDRSIWIVDFDRARILRRPTLGASRAVLARLRRSFHKLAGDRRVRRFESCWAALLDGHAQAFLKPA